MVVAFAVLRSRHALAMVNPSLPQATANAVRERLRPAARVVVRGTSIEVERYRPDEVDARWAPPSALPDFCAELAIMTSGTTTGAPRVIVAHAAQIIAACAAISERLQYSSDDVVAVIPPLSFDFGLYQLFLSVAAGSTLVVDSRMDSAQGAISALVSTPITVLPVVPSFLRLLCHPRVLGEINTGGVRLITTTGDLLTESDIDLARSAFPKALVLPMYGVSEAKRIAITPRDARRPTGSVGQPISGVDAAASAGCTARLGPGEPGDLVVAGPLLTLGYLDDVAANASRFRVDRRSGTRILVTGDRLHIDDDGWLHWHDRASDIIKTGGFRVSPAEIANAAMQTGLFREVAVYGRPDASRGQVPVLLGRIDHAVDPDTLEARAAEKLREFLPTWAVPEVSFTTKPLPRSPNGKIDRRALGWAPDTQRPDADRGALRAPLSAVRPIYIPRRIINCHTQALLSAFDLPYDVTPAEFELLTTVPFGVRAVPSDPTRLVAPMLDPDVGLDRAFTLLGVECDAVWRTDSDEAEALASLCRWLRVGPVLLGPLDLGKLGYHFAGSTLHGCDHYCVAIGHECGHTFLLRDPEGADLVRVSSVDLVRAWRAEDVPEGRGSFAMRRLRISAQSAERSSFALPARLASYMAGNLVAASEHELGGPNAWSSLRSLDLDPTNRRGLVLLLPSAAMRYRLSAILLDRLIVPASGPDKAPAWDEVRRLLDAQARSIALLHAAVASDAREIDSRVVDLSSREREVASLAATLQQAGAA